MSSPRYDLAVIGSGPAGQKAAIAAAKLGRRVVVADGLGNLGGVCLKTGTIPSKTLREAVLYLTGFRQRAFYGREGDGQGFVDGDRPPLDAISQRWAFDEFEDERLRAFGFFEAVDGSNVRMVE